MHDTGPLLGAGSLVRTMILGFVVFLIFCLAAGLLWWAGIALGWESIPAFFMGVCAGPLLVIGVLALWLVSLPLERRQKMLGVGPTHPPSDENESAG